MMMRSWGLGIVTVALSFSCVANDVDSDEMASLTLGMRGWGTPFRV